MTKELKKIKLEEIVPYDNNPRKNDHAVDDVAESIRQCGYAAPIMVDENNIILAGHTRYKALKQLGYEEVDVLVLKDMTEAQKKKYRLLDNKVGEKASWDFQLLDLELMNIDFEGYDFGFSDIENINLDSLYEEAAPKNEKDDHHEIICPHCGETVTVDKSFRVV